LRTVKGGATLRILNPLRNAHQERKVPGKKGYPQFKKNSRSVEYKQSGWKLLDPKHIEFIDKKGIGKLKLVGTWDLAFYPVKQIKRVRLVRRADGYYCQFCISVDVKVETEPTKHNVGLDVGLKEFYTDSDGKTEPNPRFYRNSEQRLKLCQKRVSRKCVGSTNRKKAINKLGRVHLVLKSLAGRKPTPPTFRKISRQREEHAKRLARCVILSNDLVAYEDLRIKNLVKNHTHPHPLPGGDGGGLMMQVGISSEKRCSAVLGVSPMSDCIKNGWSILALNSAR
jgi:putative transposase